MRKNLRKLALLLLLIFVYNLFPTKVVSAIDDINILSSTSVTAEEAKQWARSNGASSTFISLADLYWKYASQRGGVNPAIAYVQAAKETGYGKFGGVIDESFKNPCGLKITAGGDDYDPNAHQRFNSWDEGVQAHLDHLALYAGAAGYPRSDTYDPRHFSFLKGTATTVVTLGAKWAPSTSYGADIIGMYNRLTDFSDGSKLRGNLEEPSVNQQVSGSTLSVSGWALNPSGIKEIKVYIDDVFKGNATLGISRPDVYSGYGSLYKDAGTSGYKLSVTVSNLTAGSKTVRVDQVGNDGTILTFKRTIQINKLPSIGRIDSPSEGQSIAATSLKISGWSIAPSGIKEVRIYVDGKLKGTVTPSISRPDIKSAFPSYPNAEQSGYELTADISDIAGGSRIIRAEEVGNDGSVNVSQRTVNIAKLQSLGRIDAPSEGQSVGGTSLKISGWSIAASGVKEVRIYVDGNLKGTVTPSISRPDIKSAFPSYLNADKSGYELTADISDIAGGSRIIKAEEVGNDGTVNISQRTVNIAKLQSVGRIDAPSEGQSAGGTSLKISGWSIAPSGVKQVRVYVDGNLKGTVTPSISRPDIKNAFPSYPNADKSGYELTADISDIASGSRIIRAEEVGNDGTVNISQRTVNIVQLQPLGRIDAPSEGDAIKGSTMNVSGWAISNSGVKSVNIYVDGKLKGTVTPSISRPDIKSAFPSYPNADKSGYSATIDVSDIAIGTRIIKVDEISNDGTVNTDVRTIQKKNLDSIGRIDSPSENQTITSNTIKVSGWSIAGSGVKEVKVYIDGNYKGTASLSIARPDVAAAYPNYKNIDNCGYELSFDISDIPRGNRVIKTEEVANDGTIGVSQRTVNISRKVGIGAIDTPTSSQLVLSDNLVVSGWATNDINTSAVNIYIDGSLASKATIGINRPDVQAAYPNYQAASNSGYSATVDLTSLSFGRHVITAEVVGIDGSVTNMYRDFYYKVNQKLVVIDPGHNFGGDDGAYSTFDGVTYSERDLNMDVALKLQADLQARGYQVILTRKATDREILGVTQSLTNRVNLANSLNADLFISIHQNCYTSESATGTEVYYTTNTQDSNFPAQNRDYKLLKSTDLAPKISSAVSSKLGFFNRGAKDGNLFVLRNTTMPAVLVECGFISNSDQVKSLSDGTKQWYIADSIADSVRDNF